MDEVKVGFCQCCGKAVKLINPKGTRQSEWDTIATDSCSCQKKERKFFMHKDKLTLATLCGGAVQEKVDRALEKVARNILDPNSVQNKKRTVTLKITLVPYEESPEDVMVSADVSYQLAPEVGVQTSFYVGEDKGNISIMEHKNGEIKGQLDFSDIGFEPENKDVINFKKVAK